MARSNWLDNRDSLLRLNKLILHKSDKCKFKDCLHLDEPNCNIKSEIINGEIFESRYNTYLDMLKDHNIYRKSDESSNSES